MEVITEAKVISPVSWLLGNGNILQRCYTHSPAADGEKKCEGVHGTRVPAAENK